MQQNTSLYRDSDINSAGDILRKMGTPAQSVDLITGKVIMKKTLSGDTRYSYCPFCYQRAKRSGQDYKAVIRPLLSVTYKNLYRVDQTGTAKIVFEKELVCPVCRELNGQPKRISLDDFTKAYAQPYREDASLFLNVNDSNALKLAGFEEFGESMSI